MLQRPHSSPFVKQLALAIAWLAITLGSTLPASATTPPPPSQTVPYTVTDSDMTLGEANAPVTIIEYASLSCTHCAHFHNETFPALKEKYIDTGKVRFVFRDFPFNAPALRGAMLAHCAGPDRYFSFLKVLFRTQDKWAFNKEFMDNLKIVAELGGMGGEAFDKCMQDTKLETKIIEIKKEGHEKMGVKATPTLIINGRVISGGRLIEELSAIIDPLLDVKTPSETPQ